MVLRSIKSKQKSPIWQPLLICAQDGTRTHTGVNPIEPETILSTNSNTWARHKYFNHDIRLHHPNWR